MELKELTDKTLQLFHVTDVADLGKALMAHLDDTDSMREYKALVDGDLTKDWLQMIYQYYMADREKKKQDFTPACLGKLMSKLAGSADTIVDMCAGSGALTIQRWAENPGQKFELYEIDENVIPYMLYNLALRNIEADVWQGDVLTGDFTARYKIMKGEEYGKVTCVQSTI
ncbi:MAG: N-6 DNA methylase [Lactimicrobium massiliense]|nr:N-6 DNA methylase [Lactimicrobium massiliense]MDD6559451.1 N-6 DNA methylase [Lactimicrobium massiliense]